MHYLKYYFLEDYLFGEVRKNFKKRGYLTLEEFFCIIIWKSNRAKTAIKRKLLKLGSLREVIRRLTSEIFHTLGTKQKLELLIKNWTFNLPIASAILTVLYPNDFTIYDVRVRGQLNIRDFAGRRKQIEKYFSEFLPQVMKVGGKSLRDKDRYLWGKSFYEDLMKFLGKRRNKFMNYKGVIIEESLENKDVLKDVTILSTKVERVTDEHQTPWLKEWTLHMVEISEDRGEEVAEKISKVLETSHGHWYADFKNEKFHYVIFRGKVFKVDRSKPGQYEEVTKYGVSLGIPDYQLDFSPHIQEWKRDSP